MDFYNTPYVFVGNKIQSEDDKEFIEEALGNNEVFFFSEESVIKRNPGKIAKGWSDSIELLVEKTKKLSKNNRLERTKNKFLRNKSFQESK